MNDYTVTIDSESLNKHTEELCGDFIDLTHTNDSKTIVLSDGLGSGVKANILSTLSATMISTMISQGISIEACIDTVAHTLPICKERGLAYSTFTIIHLLPDNMVEIINYDNPDIILLRNGKAQALNQTELIIRNKRIKKCRFELEEHDIIIAMSDGCVHAGVGESLNYGWQHENIVSFLESMYIRDYSSKAITKLLIDECNHLYQSKPGDDTTVLSLKVKKKEVINVCVGPPENKA
ncbi:MAG: SpoIIE family protein phosphatase, partial [Bacillota bacterium]